MRKLYIINTTAIWNEGLRFHLKTINAVALTNDTGSEIKRAEDELQKQVPDNAQISTVCFAVNDDLLIEAYTEMWEHS